MVVFWILLIIVLLVFAFWMFSTRCIRRAPGFYGLADDHYAHRGLHAASHGIPENSLRAFKLAADAGYGAELDVHLTKDGRLAVMHDDSLLRTCGVDRRISEMTAEELSACRLLGSDEPVPFLEQVIPLFAGKHPLIIELKSSGENNARLASKVCKLLRNYPDLKFCIESFDPRILIWLKHHRPDIIRGQLSANFFRTDEKLPWLLKLLLTNLSTNFLTNPHFIAYKLEDRNQFSFRQCRKLWGVQEFNFTVQNEKDAEVAVRDDRIIIFEGFLPQ